MNNENKAKWLKFIVYTPHILGIIGFGIVGHYSESKKDSIVYFVCAGYLIFIYLFEIFILPDPQLPIPKKRQRWRFLPSSLRPPPPS